jgi:hypothetical protein
MKSGSTHKVRCAIYTRVSTDQGLDQDFNSLDAQYEAAAAYIRVRPTLVGPTFARDMMMRVIPADRLNGRPCSDSLRRRPGSRLIIS